ncbi:TPA: DUF3892 domain-containing protein [Klebsiella pneumoniae]|jgi:hypothetical protein|uniref:DUF3892 domain-containing protein n=1 Tax=Klebsiella/Raoultella group TaxID=2890311 RepID=UPI0007CA11AC|nr:MULTISPECIES: DUF3892 domain-containing protein [Klebsiella/Raoultella group]MVX98412.1 DUF3892 domain-containing protein [Enterobacteriaceae bacterium 8376wB9]MVY08430.1 DUF3892 domain-containing protein [Enterobacteriaceae bacterium 8376wH8]HBR8097907.1 DUF3892 domain-containing protein [Klebsiella variicola subsp. variicola]HDT3656030.1 DUF3892 domain-containing protein [Klebsiella pneumoniae subsp. pneumoniae]ASV21944.1 DUF3892 domain-containing protein [Klebsiella quasivariicola]
MTDKWADYLISKVRYNDSHTHITHVYVHVDKGDSVGGGTSETRQWVVNKIDSGYTFYTIFKDDNGKWSKGQKVIKDPVNGTNYITTRPNGTAKDNLENLPEY